MTAKNKWDLVTLGCSFVAIINLYTIDSKVVAGICLFGIIVGICNHFDLSWW